MMTACACLSVLTVNVPFPLGPPQLERIFYVLFSPHTLSLFEEKTLFAAIKDVGASSSSPHQESQHFIKASQTLNETNTHKPKAVQTQYLSNTHFYKRAVSNKHAKIPSSLTSKHLHVVAWRMQMHIVFLLVCMCLDEC